jgi:hypothetical protein
MYPDSSTHSSPADVDPSAPAQTPEEIVKKIETIFRSAYRRTQILISANDPDHLTRQEQCSIFQFIILHWTILLRLPKKILQNFTLYDFVNMENRSFEIRRSLGKPALGSVSVAVSDWMYSVMLFYFTHIRMKWVSQNPNAADITTILSFTGYFEKSSFFFVNSCGNNNINFSKAVQRYQKRTPKNAVNAATVRCNPILSRAMDEMRAESRPRLDEMTIEEMFPHTIGPNTVITTQKTMMKKLKQRQPNFDPKVARKQVVAYHASLHHLKNKAQAMDIISALRYSKPTPALVERYCVEWGWTPIRKIEKMVQKWWEKPPSRENLAQISHDRMTKDYYTPAQMNKIYKYCYSQQWPNVQIKNNIPMENDGKFTYGRGVVAEINFSKDDIICDYHGEHVPGTVATEIMNTTDESDRRSDYLMSLANDGGIHITSHDEFCLCHPEMRTVGRLINWAQEKSEPCNMKLIYYNFTHLTGRGSSGALFVALKDIPAMQELRYDYGDRICKTMFK